jgi:hypothetical protein
VKKRIPVPLGVLLTVPRGQKRALQGAIRGIGGWAIEYACGRKSRKPPRTWPSTADLVHDIENEHGIDLGAFDPGCLKDPFCGFLELKGKRCPDTKAKGGWGKAARIGLGSKSRRFSELKQRPQWRALQDALKQCENIQLHPNALRDVELADLAIDECEARFEGERDRLVDLARSGVLAAMRRAGASVIIDDDEPF